MKVIILIFFCFAKTCLAFRILSKQNNNKDDQAYLARQNQKNKLHEFNRNYTHFHVLEKKKINNIILFFFHKSYYLAWRSDQ